MRNSNGGHLAGAATPEPHGNDGDTDPRLITRIRLSNYKRIATCDPSLPPCAQSTRERPMIPGQPSSSEDLIIV